MSLLEKLRSPSTRRYLIAQVGLLVVELAVLFSLVSTFGEQRAALGYLVSYGIMTVLHFFVHKYYTYRREMTEGTAWALLLYFLLKLLNGSARTGGIAVLTYFSVPWLVATALILLLTLVWGRIASESIFVGSARERVQRTFHWLRQYAS